MLNTEPDIVIVEIGGNDALRGIDLALTHKNIDEMVSRFSESGAVVIVAGLQIIQNLGAEYTTEFAAIYPQVAKNHNAILIPFMLEGVAADPALNQADFIHPNADGYAVTRPEWASPAETQSLGTGMLRVGAHIVPPIDKAYIQP